MHFNSQPQFPYLQNGFRATNFQWTNSSSSFYIIWQV